MSRNMQVIHVFQEDDLGWQAEHLEYWFGFLDPSDLAAAHDPRILCYCGGRLVPLKVNPKDASDIQVGAIWHKCEFNPDTWLPPEAEKYFNKNWQDVPETPDDDDMLFGSDDE